MPPAPAGTLGLIAVWDEGDPLHNEPLSPYVHARDIALVRQELQGCALFFVSHARTNRPNVIGGTKCPSMTSQWMTRQPSSMLSFTWEERREKDADRS